MLRLRLREHCLDDIGAEFSRTKRPQIRGSQTYGAEPRAGAAAETHGLKGIRRELRRGFEKPMPSVDTP